MNLLLFRYTGPAVDHTTGTDKGYYLYIESSGGLGKMGDKAWLVSEHIPASSYDHCFTFYYHMKGNGKGNTAVQPNSVNVLETRSFSSPVPVLFSLQLQHY